MTRLLIEKDADVEARNENGNTPLHLAAQTDSLRVARLLIDIAEVIYDGRYAKRPIVDTRNENGNTPLHLAFHANSYKVADLLIEHNANTEGIDVNRLDRSKLFTLPKMPSN